MLDLTIEAQRCSLHAQEGRDDSGESEEPEEFFDRQLTKAIPPHFTGEWRTLAESIRSSILTSNPNVRWDAIVGQEVAAQLLQEAVVQPLKFPKLFTGVHQVSGYHSGTCVHEQTQSGRADCAGCLCALWSLFASSCVVILYSTMSHDSSCHR
jgi:SpoVK/Ycf46/Vps4 family AAA+-type ATPase